VIHIRVSPHYASIAYADDARFSVLFNSYELHEHTTAGHSGPLPFADPEVCSEYDITEALTSASRLGIDRECFNLPPGDLEKSCLHYLEGEAGICYVRSEAMIIDSKNVIYWNALRTTDIVMVNTGLHHNARCG
jgi:hypothetical protein